MTERFQILSLDGGGIRGMFSAALLAHIERDLGVSITDHFDLIAGTSTGGIIALGLGLGLTPEEILGFYVDHGKSMFPASPFRRLRHLVRNKYDSRGLELALRECFGEQLIGESKRMLVIPSFDLAHTDVALFKTAHHEDFVRDYKMPAWKVAMATTAAPTYFPGFSQIEDRTLIDGGVWANNPTMVALAEAVGILKVPVDQIRILSIGTFEEISAPPKRLTTGGLLQWARLSAKTIMAGQNAGAKKQAQLMVGKENLVRINPVTPKGLYQLDAYTPKELLGKAAMASKHKMPIIRKTFLDHKAPPFVPANPLSPEIQP
ncbi:CBASS cGAMP-activated phospholipase [Solemya elarraichensis gill symbiont]|uniref:PNPLA domain-containing protein n=1 Tax=Solemya elarraichensis gill symbiont TaxID=1918949 RepID=A0A1T2L1I0_9GAMM|nr:CBASS cGAMP-activated phospholipase [Solemya elarraichensis gill symbiont]OOZ38958.1 hypothetical protein BOW52_07825 [Solemya elarraichensis gill symbiont]